MRENELKTICLGDDYEKDPLAMLSNDGIWILSAMTKHDRVWLNRKEAQALCEFLGNPVNWL